MFSGFVEGAVKSPIQVRSCGENLGVGRAGKMMEMKKPQPEVVGA